MKYTIAAVIVLYNEKIENSVTYEKLKNIEKSNIHTIIVDNSDIPNQNDIYCKKNAISYICMGGNKGLSKAYNAAIDSCNDEVIVLLDDDTEITEEYFDVLNSALMENPEVQIFAPIVYGQDGKIYSPNEFSFLRNHFISSADQSVAQQKFNAIASCLAIRREIFKEYRFNEKLFVDQVDQNFFCEQRKLGAKFMKLNVEIHQNFYQRGQFLSATAGWKRLQLRIVDIMRHAKLLGGGTCHFSVMLNRVVWACKLG